MSDLILCLLAAIGLCHIVVDGLIFAPLRSWVAARSERGRVYAKLHEAVQCYQCSGFWCGLLVGALYWLSDDFAPARFVLYAGAASFLAPVSVLVVTRLESKPESN